MSRRPNSTCCVAGFFLLLLAVARPVAANQPPRAVAAANFPPGGAPQSNVRLLVGPTPGDTVNWSVDGNGSSDPDGDPLTFSWQCWMATGNKCLLSISGTNTAQATALFPAGVYNFTLTVKDPSGASSTDTAQVEVIVDNLPPQVLPPENATFSTTEMGGARATASTDLNKFLFVDPYAKDPLNLQFLFTALPPQVNGMDVDSNTLFPPGPSIVTFRFADTFGNVGAATANLYVTDAQYGDLFVGGGRVIDPFGGTAGQVMLVRGGAASLFCQGPNQGPLFFHQNVEVLADSLGRAIFLAHMPSTNSSLPHSGLFRCDFPGDTPRLLGVYEGFGSRPAGDPVQFPGDKFGQTGGLHLARTRAIVIQNDTAQIVNEDSYVFAAKRVVGTFPFNHISLKSVRFRSLAGISEDGPEPEQQHNSGSGFIPDMLNYKGDTYSAGRGGVVRRQTDPLTIQASGSAFGTQFNLSISLLGGTREINSLTQTLLMDDVNTPNVASNCPPPPAGVSAGTPASAGSYYSFQTEGEILVTPDWQFGLMTTWNGLGMCGTTLTPTCPWSPYIANVDQYLIDDDPQNDNDNRFQRPEVGCAVQRSVPVRPVMPQTAPATNLPNDPSKMVLGPTGVFATQFPTGRVFRVPDSPAGVQDLLGSPLPAAWGIAAFPPQYVSPSGLVIVIQINSPVDVLVTDPAGRRIGMDSGGVPVNDFGEKGYDTGPGSHPRFYVIRGAAPGRFAVSSVGTGSGPFEIHTFALNLDRTFGEHLLSSGNASPGAATQHDFTLDATGAIVLSNTAPNANAGADQTVTADSSGNATVALDGAASSDPDGDALSFTWGGPFGVLSGATVNATLPVGVHELTLTVDDGKGGLAKDNVIITVVAVPDTAPPVLTLPANITTPATSAAGAVVNYTASALDAVDGPIAPACAPPSGSTFPIGTVTVNCSASDAAGNSASGSFDITVTPLPPPTGAPNITAQIAATGAGPDATYFLDVQFTNTGGGPAASFVVRFLNWATTAGAGTVSYAKRISPRLPINVGALAPGGSATVRFYFLVPVTVSQFSLTLRGPFSNSAGQVFEFGQTLGATPAAPPPTAPGSSVAGPSSPGVTGAAGQSGSTTRSSSVKRPPLMRKARTGRVKGTAGDTMKYGVSG